LLSKLHESLGTAVRPLFAVATRVIARHYAFRTLGAGASVRLRAAPPDLRTGDPTVAEDIFSGIFAFRGKTLDAGGLSPFALTAPSAEWRRALCGFSWLRHLRAADTPRARDYARGLVADYLSRPCPVGDPAREPNVAARRVLSCLAHAPLLLEGADAPFQERLSAALAEDARALARAVMTRRAEGQDRLFCALALLEFVVCADLAVETRSQATKLFFDELARQALPDGGHVGRNPHTILDLLLELLALRALYAARGVNAPPALQETIDRMIPALRMLRHGDGALALFNGMSVASPGELATVFMHETPFETPEAAPQSGYLRLSAGEALALIDAGTPPPRKFSRRAHAGALSFEFSLGRDRVIINCGAPTRQDDPAQELARATAAHSTLEIGGDSSCAFAPSSEARGSGFVIAGPTAVNWRVRQLKGLIVARLRHDGYARRFGLIHQRTLALAADGASLFGRDRLLAAAGARIRNVPEFVLHFHLHPGVEARAVAEDRVELRPPNGRTLVFQSRGAPPAIADSVIYATPEGARKTAQIVLRGRAAAGTRLRWSLRRLNSAEIDDDQTRSLASS